MTRGYDPRGFRDKRIWSNRVSRQEEEGGEIWSHKLDKGKLCHRPGQAHEARQGAVGPTNKPALTTKGRGKWLTLVTEGRGREWLQNTGKTEGRWPKRRTDRLIPDTPRPGNRDGHTTATNRSSNSRQKSYSWFMSYVVSC